MISIIRLMFFSLLTAGASVPAVAQPALATSPSHSVFAGAPTALWVRVSGEDSPAYQWYRGISGDISQPVPGATRLWLATPPLVESANYWVRVSGASGATDSATIALTVRPPPARAFRHWGGSLTQPLSRPLNDVVGIAAHQMGGTENGFVTALRVDGTAATWGASVDRLRNLTNIRQVTTSYALLQDGRVIGGSESGDIASGIAALSGIVAIAEGMGNFLAIRNDGSVFSRSTDQPVPTGLSNVIAVAAGEFHSVALKSDGTVVAWGVPTSGKQHGQTAVPVGLSGVTAIAAGIAHTLALKSDGTVVMWGRRGSGYANFHAGLTGVTAIAAGGDANLVRKSDGSLATWNQSGVAEPAIPSSLGAVTAIAVSYYHAYHVVKADGTVASWNTNIVEPPVLSTYTKLKVAYDTIGYPGYKALARKVDGTVVGLGYTGNGAFSVPAGIGPVLDIAVGHEHGLVARVDGTVAEWGRGIYTVELRIPVPPGLTGVIAVAAGTTASLALRYDGTVVGWGISSDLAAAGAAAVPAGLSGVKSIAVGDLHSLALKHDGTVVAWGMNTDGESTVPAGLTNVVAVACGRRHSVALRADGTVVAWGRNTNGESTVPAGLTDVVAIAAASSRTIALRRDGRLVVWGFQAYAAPPGLRKIEAVTAASNLTAVLFADMTDPAQPPFIVASAPSRAIPLGAAATLTVAAEGVGLTYQWYRGNRGDTSTPVAGATLAGFTTPVLTEVATYWARVSNSQGHEDSEAATVTPLSVPTLSVSTGSHPVFPGGMATLAVTSTTGGIAYQWYRGGTGDTSSPVTGATQAAFTTPALAATTSYWVRVSNVAGQADSPTLTATVLPHPFEGWTWHNPQPQGNNLSSIAYGNGRFVAASRYGTVLVSPDAATWTLRQTPVAKDLRSIVWTGSRFVAVGLDRTILVSPDGETWSQIAATPGPSGFSGVFAGGGRVILTGISGAVLVSTDGLSWALSDAIAGPDGPADLNAMVWTGDRFVALSFSGHVFTSSDGSVWTYRVPVSFSPSGLAANGTIVVAVQFDGSIRTTVDGTAWTVRTSGTTSQLGSVIWTGSQFVALGAFGAPVLQSTDGITWTTASTSPPATASYGSMAAGGGKIVAVGSSGAIATSTDGNVWVEGHSSRVGSFAAIVRQPGGYLAIEQSGRNIWSSTDALSWTGATYPTSVPFLNALVWNGSRYVAVGRSGVVYTSEDGSNWTQGAAGTGHLNGLVWSGTQYVAVGDGGSVRTSPDAIAWTTQSSGITDALMGVAWNGTTFVAVGGGGRILTSPTGVVWTQRTSGVPTAFLYAVAWAGGQFVAAASNGIFTSPDGIDWTVRRSGSSESYRALAHSGRSWIAVGTGGIVAYSSDGATWDRRHTGTQSTLNTVIWNGTRFIAAGGEALVSAPDLEAAASPSILPIAGTYTPPLAVSIATAISGGAIRYTLDGSEPIATSALYTGPFSLSASATVKARAFAPTLAASPTVTAAYVVQSLPQISAHPQSATAVAGTTVQFGVTASGTPVPTYQWRKGGEPIAGATNATLVFSPVQVSHAGTYDVVVSNSAGNAPSNLAVLTVAPAPVPPTVALTAPAEGSTFAAGTAVALAAAAADSDGTVAGVVFRLDGSNLSTDTTAPYEATWTPAAPGTYTLTARATDNADLVTDSAPRTVTVVAAVPPIVALTAPAAGSSFLLGSSIVLTATATAHTGRTIAGVEFFAGPTSLGSDTSAPYTVTWTPAAAGTYNLTARATDNFGGASVSIAVTVTVALPAAAPTITTPLTNLTVNAGQTATFSVAANGEPAPTFQWQVKAAGQGTFTNVSDGGGVSGAATPTLTLSGVTLAMNGDQYRCVATNGVEPAATSEAATLSVVQPPTITSANQVAFQVNQSSSFTVTATGSPAPTFGLAAGTLPAWATLNPTTGVLAGTPPDVLSAPFSFTLRAANGVSPDATQLFTLTVQLVAPPVITLQPVSTTVASGATATLSVTATGTGLTYQWYRGNSGDTSQPIEGATSASFTTPGVSTTTSYWVRLSSGAAGVDSATATVTVATIELPTVALTAPATGATVAVGASVNLAAIATAGTGRTIAGVEFLAGMTSLGSDTTSPYSVAWTPAAAGTYSLTARATDNFGGVATSAAVAVVVEASTIPVNVTLAPVADTTIYSDGTTALANAKGVSLFAGRSGQGRTLRALLRFDLAGQIPAGATVTAATLTLATTTPKSHPLTVEVRRVAAAWGEGTSDAGSGEGGGAPVTAGDATWLSRFHGNAPAAWTAPGGDFSATASASQSVPNTTGTVTITSAALAADVQAWLGNPEANHGWLLRAQDESAAAARFSSREGVTPPSLQISYTPAANAAPVIASQPVARTVNAGQTATFTVTATGQPAPAYQWQVKPAGEAFFGDLPNGNGIGGATTATLTIVGVTASLNGSQYRCLVSNGIAPAAISSAALLTVQFAAAPVITTQPASTSVAAGATAILAVSATGAGLTHQWYRGASGDTSQPIDGATTAGYTTPALSATGSYWVRVTGGGGSVDSATATVTVAVPPQVSHVFVGKSVKHLQTGPATTALRLVLEGHPRYGGPFGFGVDVGGQGIATMAAPQVTLPPGSVFPPYYELWFNNGVLGYNAADGEWKLGSGANSGPPDHTPVPADNAGAMSRDWIDLRYPNGTYIVRVAGVDVPLTLAGDAYPAVPVIALTGGTWIGGVYQFDRAQPVGISVPAFAGFGTHLDDVMTLSVGDEEVVQRWASTNSSTAPLAHTLPANTVPPGEEFEIEADFVAVVGKSTALAGSLNAAYYSRDTGLRVRAIAGAVPTIAIAAPAAGATIAAGSTVSITTSATDADGSVARVDFFVNGSFVGGDTSAPFALEWTPRVAGAYALSARATDNGGAQADSASVSVTVAPGENPPAIDFVGVEKIAQYAQTGPTTVAQRTEATAYPGYSGAFRFGAWVDASSRLGVPAPVVTLPAGSNLPTAQPAWFNSGVMRSIDEGWDLGTGSWSAPTQAEIDELFAPGVYRIAVAGVSVPLFLAGDQYPAPAVVSLTGGAWSGGVYVFNRATPVTISITPHAGWGSNANDAAVLHLDDEQVAFRLRTENASNAPLTFTLPAHTLAAGAEIVGEAGLIAMTDSSTVLPGSLNFAMFSSATFFRLRALESGSPPAVALTAPASGTNIVAGTATALTAAASDGDGTIAQVQFFANGTAIGASTIAPYSVSWTPANAGPVMLTARATDNAGLTADSAGVAVVVTAPPPPTVALTAPVDGTTVVAGNAVALTATATAAPGRTVANVQFLAGATVTVAGVTPPVIVTPPGSRTTAAGASVGFEVVAGGTAPLSYQWFKDDDPLAGRTAATLALDAVDPAAAGGYRVRVTNGGGFADSATATLTVIPAGTAATHAVVGSGYTAGGTATITSMLSYPGTATELRWQVLLPAEWSFASDSGAVGSTKPAAGATELLEWLWSPIAPSPVTFTYTLNVPAGQTGAKPLVALAQVRLQGTTGLLPLLAQPDPLVVAGAAGAHDADTDRNFRISLLELTRAIELYNTRNGTTRTGAYKVDETGEDGFNPEPSRTNATVVTLTRYHSGDSDRNGRFALLELTRAIELYNFRSGTTRTGQYRVQPGTEDGFAPGP